MSNHPIVIAFYYRIVICFDRDRLSVIPIARVEDKHDRISCPHSKIQLAVWIHRNRHIRRWLGIEDHGVGISRPAFGDTRGASGFGDGDTGDSHYGSHYGYLYIVKKSSLVCSGTPLPIRASQRKGRTRMGIVYCSSLGNQHPCAWIRKS
ncbi:MAG: hypothetical protein KIPDCIKN_02026 [Haliscomenobacter sp.]|nr:hypothetical protein [Haliscomenobacter sp.]